MIFFFFSSRRRHTRYWRDWSSDVCSSDLGGKRRSHQKPPGGDSETVRGDGRPLGTGERTARTDGFRNSAAQGETRGFAEHAGGQRALNRGAEGGIPFSEGKPHDPSERKDRKSTRLNSSHAN